MRRNNSKKITQFLAYLTFVKKINGNVFEPINNTVPPNVEGLIARTLFDENNRRNVISATGSHGDNTYNSDEDNNENEAIYDNDSDDDYDDSWDG